MEKIYLCSAENCEDHPVFHVSMAGITYPDPGYKIMRANSETCVIEYVLDGEGTVIVDGNTYHVSCGDSYFLPAGHRHHYYSSPENPFTKIWINFTGTLCDNLLSSYDITNLVHFPRTDILNPLENFVLQSGHLKDSNEINSAGALAFHRIVQILHSNRTQSSQTTAAVHAKNYIQRHIYERITAEQIADHIGLSVSQLGRCFKSQYSQTVYAYILDCKIKTAENLLKNTTLPVKEISYMLGFADEHYFSGIFKKKKNSTPLEYRKGSIHS